MSFLHILAAIEGVKYMHEHFFSKTIGITKSIIQSKIKEGNVAIDATVGNGHDTILLAQMVGISGKVYGFDIQTSAINNTKSKILDNHLIDRVELIQDSHANIDKYISRPIDIVVFNLGYLPGSDHSIITQAESTITAIDKSLRLLKKKGILLITSYVGHLEGATEGSAVESFLTSLNQKDFNVIKFQFINQINNPPLVYGVEKR